MRLLLIPAFSVLALVSNPEGCAAQDSSDAGAGTAISNFSVHGTLIEATCGPTAFGASDTWDFVVKLSKDGTKLYWINGNDTIEGTVSADGLTFGLQAQLSVRVADATVSKPGCVVIRDDAIEGTLPSASSDVSGFKGRLTYRFSQTTGSDCSEPLAAEGVTVLPCILAYDIVGTRM